jgi:hypothetical protein
LFLIFSATFLANLLPEKTFENLYYTATIPNKETVMNVNGRVSWSNDWSNNATVRLFFRNMNKGF